jgi:tRNA nucleotidyltransferase (CCA-adding enzyme)
MDTPPPAELLARLEALPAAGPLLERLGDDPHVYVVGGAVRDLLLGRAPSELDLVVDGDALAVAERLGGRLVVHDRFGTSTVLLDGHRYDIARSRRETYARPGALPDVAPAPLSEDLLRRDFTVNAIALSIGGDRAGTIESVPGAVDDLESGLLRVLHALSFTDDPTRLLRLARYASRLSFAVEPATLELAREAIAANALSTVSGARIGAELRLLAREPDPVAAFEALHELDLDAAIEPGFGIADPGRARRALELLPADGRPELLAMMSASARIEPERVRAMLDRLAFEAHDRDAIVVAVQRAPELAVELSEANRPSQIAAAVGDAGPELVALAGAEDASRAAATEWLEHLRHIKLEIDGSDLLEAGVPQGPEIGRGLAAALGAKLDGRATGREAELREALAAARDRRD